MTPLLLSVPEAAAALGCSRYTVYRLIADGELPTVEFRRGVRISTKALHEFIAEREVPAYRRIAQ